MAVFAETLSYLCSDPLFSTIVTLYTLIFFFFPSLFNKFVFYPIIISTTILLLSLLRLGASQNSSRDPDPKERGSSEFESSTHISPQQIQESVDGHDQKCVSSLELAPEPNPYYTDSFLEWDVRAPLEVIYEEYEGEEAKENEDVISEETRESQLNIIQRYASLSLFYPESDTDGSSEDDFPTNGVWDSSEDVCLRWEEEDRDGLIEIALDEKRDICEVDEENLIEIDLSPAG